MLASKRQAVMGEREGDNTRDQAMTPYSHRSLMTAGRTRSSRDDVILIVDASWWRQRWPVAADAVAPTMAGNHDAK